MFPRNKKTKLIIKFFVFFIIFSSIFFYTSAVPVRAAGITEISVSDIKTELEQKYNTVKEEYLFNKDWWQDKVWSSLKNEVLNQVLQQVAYDTATYLGSGGEGGKAWWRKENMETYMRNVADDAAGTFIENMAQKSGFLEDFDICEPDMDLKMRIGLGLVEEERPEPTCNFTEMKDNWEEELKSENFLTDLSDMFYASDDLPLNQVVDINMALNKEKLRAQLNKQQEDEVDEGWDKDTGPAREQESPPGEKDRQAGLAYKIFGDKFTANTGHPLEDAVAVFVNQLAYTAFQTAMNTLGEDAPRSTSPYSGDYGGLEDYESGSGASRQQVEEKTSKIKEPRFDVKGDYDVLAQLTMCPDPQKPKTDECVLDQKFSQAIQQKLTVGEAMEKGYLKKDAVFGYRSGGKEPRYNEGYPHRSILILKKYRIVPVGWDMAAQYIRDNSGELINLGDLVSCYASDDDWDNGYIEDWCRGLVDPDWVLKAPLNYCQREGYGENKMMKTITGNKEEDSRVEVSRKEYCSDEQTCIKEGEGGSCEYYGYCTAERRIWDFGADSCNPLYNTCQTFQAREGGKVSYLKNTLDYSDCGPNSAGCQAYARASGRTPYNIASNTLEWEAANQSSYFNKNVEECDPGEEGCHEFLRVAAGSGGNLFSKKGFGNGFENKSDGDIVSGSGADGDEGEVIESEEAYSGTKVLELNGSFKLDVKVAPDDYDIGGETYTLSFFAKNCGSNSIFQLSSPPSINSSEVATSSFSGADTWTRYSLNYDVEDISDPAGAGAGNELRVSFINSGNCLIDAVKLEKGGGATAYSDYRQGNTVYQKLLPEYMESECYKQGGNKYKEEADPRCYNYVRECNAEEVGCNLYQEQGSNFEVPAQAIAQDHCPGECVGFDTYIQDESHFSSRREENFIPRTAETCGAQAAGCEEFTNLDKLEQGGEAREYYTQLRHCVDENNSDCAVFYTWQGDKEEGQQLVSHTLVANGGEPEVTSDDSAECSEEIYKLPPSDPAYNSDCREFYNKQGGVSYHLFTRTISCSQNCHAYRITRNNIDPDLETSSECSANGSNYSEVENDQFHWDGASGVCYFCKNGGEWSSEHQSCIYHGIPGQGETCSAPNKGCREYNGNQGNNIRMLLVDSFESGAENWDGGSVASESLRTEEHSLQFSGSEIEKTVGEYVSKGNGYVLEFLAKNEEGGSVSASLNNSGSSTDFVFSNGENNLSGEWKLYRANMEKLDHEASAEEKLLISASSDTYIDNIKITEILDRYYLIRDSWQTPRSCNRDIYGNPSPLYMLGCSAYVDQEGDTHYLHEFDSLCSEDSVGCEIMIDTHNYEEKTGKTWDSYDPAPEVFGDEFVYAVYDTDKQCGSPNLGCERFGQTFDYEDDTVYRDVYLKNNPNKYGEILCGENNVGCEEWGTEEGSEYFKDPGKQVCEYKQGPNGDYNWYKKYVKKCFDSGDYSGDYCLDARDCATSSNDTCEEDSDCGDDQTCWEGRCHWACEMSASSIECPTEDDILSIDAPKTLGKGGERIQQPEDEADTDWVGICPASQSGCTEYVDPYSKLSPDLLSDRYQNSNISVKIEPYTLYYDPGSLLDQWSDISNIIFSGSNLKYYNAGDPGYLQATGDDLIRKAVVNYAFRSEVDRETCNGVYNYDKGCILFNERSYDSEGDIQSLVYNAEETDDEIGDGNPPAGGSPRDSNVLLKVSPDRECDEWLACKSFIKKEGEDQPTCLDVGICNSLNNRGECDNFASRDDHKFDHYLDNNKLDNIDNLSGYSKVAYEEDMDFEVSELPLDLYHPGSMEEHGYYFKVQNGSFENYGEYRVSTTSEETKNYPYSWTPNLANPEAEWTNKDFSVITNPVAAQSRGLDYPIDGDSFLKFASSDNSASPYSENVPVITGENHYLSFYINTKDLGGAEGCVAFVKIDWGSNSEVMEVEPGRDWDLKMKEFIPDASSINIHLGAYADQDNINSTTNCRGDIYIDDIRVEPTLKVNDDWNKRQSCRLYPEEDSLSCRYRDESGYQYLGQKGYCLEYDHAPGNKDACLLWWPVDKVRGQTLEENAGYSGRYPVYNCTEVNMNFELVENRRIAHRHESSKGILGSIVSLDLGKAWERITDNPIWALASFSAFLGPGLLAIKPFNDATLDDARDDLEEEGKLGCLGSGCGQCAFGYWFEQEVDCGWDGCEVDYYCRPLKAEHIVTKEINDKDVEWYRYNGDFQKYKEAEGKNNDEAILKVNGTKIGDPLRVYFYSGSHQDELMTFKEAINKNLIMSCNKMVQVVSGSGNAKPWTSRLSPASEFKIIRDAKEFSTSSTPKKMSIEYLTPYSPYGAIDEIEPPQNPADWDPVPNQPNLEPVVVGRSGYALGGVTAGCKGVNNNNAYNNCSLLTEGNVSYGRLGICSGSSQNCLAYSVRADFALEMYSGDYANDKDRSIEDTIQKKEVTNPNTGETKIVTSSSFTSIAYGNNPRNITPYRKYHLGPKYTCPEGQECLPLAVLDNEKMREKLKNVYVESYNSFKWDGNNYTDDDTVEPLSPPEKVCPSPGGSPARPDYDRDNPDKSYCGIPPRVENIEINGESRGKVFLNNTGKAEITFTTNIDSQQIPITEIRIKLGNKKELSSTGAKIKEKNDPDNPHMFVNNYSYSELSSEESGDGITCRDNYCEVSGDSIQVQVKDNWGWCNNDNARGDCNDWDSWEGTLRVYR